jgi:hypothetical protein
MKPIRLMGRSRWAINDDGISFCESRRSLGSHDRMPNQRVAVHVDIIPEELVHRRERRLVEKGKRQRGFGRRERLVDTSEAARDVEERRSGRVISAELQWPRLAPENPVTDPKPEVSDFRLFAIESLFFNSW